MTVALLGLGIPESRATRKFALFTPIEGTCDLTKAPTQQLLRGFRGGFVDGQNQVTNQVTQTR